MGTRADFYIGTGDKAEWLGSVGWDGYEWDADKTCPLMTARTEDEYRAAVKVISEKRKDWTSPEQGWPWPWHNSDTTDVAYAFEDGNVRAYWDSPERGWPDMSSKKTVTFGHRSGLIVVVGR